MTAKDPKRRAAAFNRRGDWLRRLHDGEMPYLKQIERMLQIFGELGVIERRPGPKKDPAVPEVVYVETGAAHSGPAPAAHPHIAAPPRGAADFRHARFGKAVRRTTNW